MLAAACGSPSAPAASSPAASPSATPSAAAPSTSVAVAATGGTVFDTPLDAVPASDGSAIYFTATTGAGNGVFAVAKGGEPVPLAIGAPLQNPVGLALSPDDTILFVADRQADAVFTVPVSGGAPVELPGSRGLDPRGLEVADGQLYLTGTNQGAGAVFTLPLAGGTARPVAGGLADPDSVAIGSDGTVFVTDRPGSVLRIAAGTAEPIATGVRLGTPAGLTLDQTGTKLLVSSLHATAGTAQVQILDLAGGGSTVFDDVINANYGAGGLHRAHGASFAAWADVSRSGRVYRVDP